jgi:DNA-binding NarL/FixJ family response regulator
MMTSRMTSPPNTPLRLLIAEEQELVRSGLCLALQSRGGFDIVAQSDNGHDLMVKTQAFLPDVIIMDIHLPHGPGVSVIKQLRQEWPQIRVLVLTSDETPEGVLASLTAGATAYCLKTVSLESLCSILTTVAQGALWLDPKVATIVLNTLPKVTLADALNGRFDVLSGGRTGDSNVLLTEREWQVLRMIVDGKSNKEIAQLLSVSSHTAKAHVCHIIQKLNVDDRTQVAVKALREGLVDGLFEQRI